MKENAVCFAWGLVTDFANEELKSYIKRLETLKARRAKKKDIEELKELIESKAKETAEYFDMAVGDECIAREDSQRVSGAVKRLLEALKRDDVEKIKDSAEIIDDVLNEIVEGTIMV